MKIKTSILISFFVIFGIFFVSFFLFLLLEINFKNSYRESINNNIYQYQMIDISEKLAKTYASLLTDNQNPKLNSEYYLLISKMNSIFSILDTSITNEENTLIYRRIKNRIYFLENSIEEGLKNANRLDFSKNVELLEQINRQEQSIKEDASALIFSELSASIEKQSKAEKTESITFIIGILLIFLVSFGGIVSIISFSKKLSNPLERLSVIAENVLKGNSNQTVDPDLLKLKNEIGILSRSFNSMLVDVENKIYTRTIELQQERARLLSSINSLSLGFILFDSKNNVVLHNSAIEKMFHVSKEKISIDFLNEKLGIKISIEDCLRDEKLCEFKEVDWENKILQIFIAPVFLDEKNKTITDFVLLIEDVTKEKILARTKDEFFTIASHELRTPLTAIKGNAELLEKFLKKETHNEEVLEMLSDIQKESVRLISITNEFLNVSKIEQHQIKLELAPINLNVITRRVAEELQPLALEKKVSIIFDENHNLLGAIGDQDRVHEILTNLIANAIHQTRGGKVTILLENIEKNIKVSVIDTGIGIPPENQQLLFKKFQQAGKSIFTRGEEKGTGLGLYISKLLIEDMGGKIWLEKSEENIGSTFSFTLPAVI